MTNGYQWGIESQQISNLQSYIWNSPGICVSFLLRNHGNLLCTILILVYAGGSIGLQLGTGFRISKLLFFCLYPVLTIWLIEKYGGEMTKLIILKSICRKCFSLLKCELIYRYIYRQNKIFFKAS